MVSSYRPPIVTFSVSLQVRCRCFSLVTYFKQDYKWFRMSASVGSSIVRLWRQLE